MKNLKKYIGVTLCAAMAMTAFPVTGSLAKPAVVKAEEPTLVSLVEAATEKVIYSENSHKDQVELVSEVLFKANDGKITAAKDGYEYAWGTSTDNGSEYKTFQAGITASDVTITEGENKCTISIPDPTKNVLRIRKKDTTTDLGSITFELGGDAPKVTADTEHTDQFKGIAEGHQYAVKPAADGKPEWKDYSGSTNKPNPEVAEGKVQTYLVRTAGKDKKFPSAAVEVVLKLAGAITKENLKSLTFTVDDKMIKFADAETPIVNEAKTNKVLVKIGENTEVLDFNKSYDIAKATELMIYIGADTDETFEDSKGYKFTFTHKDTPQNVKKENNSITGVATTMGYRINKTGEFKAFNGATHNVEKDAYGVYEIVTLGDTINTTAVDTKAINVNSDSVVLEFINPNPIFTPEATPSTPATKTEEPKKEEPKKEEPKKEEPKKEEPKVEEPKTEAPVATEPVKEMVSSKKTGATVSVKKVDAVLKAAEGKLTVAVKGAKVVLSKAVLEANLEGKADVVKVSLKAMAPKKDSKDAKLVAKNLKKNKLAEDKVYSLSVKAGKKKFMGKFRVTLTTDLVKAPKNLHVMNIKNGNLIKAKFKKGEVTFTAKMTGKYVVVSKK